MQLADVRQQRDSGQLQVRVPLDVFQTDVSSLQWHLWTLTSSSVTSVDGLTRTLGECIHIRGHAKCPAPLLAYFAVSDT